MFRAAVLSIVLAFAAAPEATLLCRLWCPSEASASGCYHHERASWTREKASDACDAADPSVAALTREDARPTERGSGTDHPAPVQRYQLVRSTSGNRIVESWAREHALERRPLETTLRL